jgi:uracil-DNA glycosylase
MDLIYKINGKRVAWKKLSLQEYINEYVPVGWEDVFEALAEEIIPEISKKLEQYSKKNVIYPPMPFVFNALDSLQPKDVKVVIIGQDSYIKKGQAMGWSFSVPDGVKIPASLRNIYKELDIEGYKCYKNRKTGNLQEWVDKGVFLYNSCLTVNKQASGSHGNLWREFTNMVINCLQQQEYIAWIFLGKSAQAFSQRLDAETNGIFSAGHPSPLNTAGNFIGSNVFKNAEEYLYKHGREFTWNI